MAQQLAHTRFAWPEAYFMPPLYPYLLGMVDFIFGAHPFIVVFIQILLGSGSAVLVYLLALRLFNKRMALWSFVGYLLCGNVLFLDTVFLPNAFTVFGELLVSGCYPADGQLQAGKLASRRAGKLTVRSAAIRSSQFYCASSLVGVLLGLLALIRAETLLFLPLLLILIDARQRSKGENKAESRPKSKVDSKVNESSLYSDSDFPTSISGSCSGPRW